MSGHVGVLGDFFPRQAPLLASLALPQALLVRNIGESPPAYRVSNYHHWNGYP